MRASVRNKVFQLGKEDYVKSGGSRPKAETHLHSLLPPGTYRIWLVGFYVASGLSKKQALKKCKIYGSI